MSVAPLSGLNNVWLPWPNKEISVFRVTGQKALGRVGTHIFGKLFSFLEKI